MVTIKYIGENNKLITESISINENVIDKFKETLRSGLVTAAVVTALLAAPFINAQEKVQIKDIASKAGIETTSDSTKTVNDSTKTVKSIGYGYSSDLNTAKKMAILNAKSKATGNNKTATISNLKITNEKTQKNADGVYYYAVQCTMQVK